jgi:hypothetical protein
MVAENLASDTISRARSSSRPEDLSAVRSAAAGTRCAWGEVSGAVAASIAGIGSWPGPFVRGWLPSESCLLRAVVCRFCRSAWLCPLAGAWALWRGLCVEREPWLRSGAHRVLPHSARSPACCLICIEPHDQHRRNPAPRKSNPLHPRRNFRESRVSILH